MTATTTDAPTDRFDSRAVYAGLWLLAGLGYGGLIVLQRPLLAVAGFALFGLAAVAYRASRGRPLFDERDRHLRRRAAERTLRTVGVASAVFFPTVVVLWALGYHAWPPWLFYLGIYVAALTGLYGFVSVLTRFVR
jgi:uncharacterized membrane protein